MRSVTVIIALVAAGQARATEAQESVNGTIDRLVDRWTSSLWHPSAQTTDLDNSMLGKTGHVGLSGRANLADPTFEMPGYIRTRTRRDPAVHAFTGSVSLGPPRRANLKPRLRPIHAEASDYTSRLGFERKMTGLSPELPSRGGSNQLKPEDVEMKSDVGMDYTPLKNWLEKGEFQKADDETRALLIKLAGEEAVQRKWVYFSDVKLIPIADMKTLDDLWRAYSGGKFGYSVQKSIWRQSDQMWNPFLEKIKWRKSSGAYPTWPGEFVYNTSAVKGHLPLTNHLRGDQLHQAIFDHPAFNKTKFDKRL